MTEECQKKKEESLIYLSVWTQAGRGLALLCHTIIHLHRHIPITFGLPIMLKVEDMKVLDIGMKLCVPCFGMPQQKGRVVRTHANSRCA